MGPVEQIALANHPVKGLYFTVVGTPQVYKYISHISTLINLLVYNSTTSSLLIIYNIVLMGLIAESWHNNGKL